MRLFIACCLALLVACSGLPKPPAPVNPVRFLSINDVYVADTLLDGNGGMARLSTLKQRIQREGPVLFVLAGDFLSPSLLTRWYGGRQMVEALNAAGLDYATFGNHEFDLPKDELFARLAEMKFKVVSANCVQADGSPFPGVLPWDTVSVKGQRIGIFGLTLPGDYRSYVRCESPDSAARAAIDTLTALKADMIVAITHQAIENDIALLNSEGNLDLILGGHEHEAQTVAVGSRYVLKADADAVSTQFATLWGARNEWRQAPRLLDVKPSLLPDTAVEQVVDRWRDSLLTKLGPNNLVGVVMEPLDATSLSLQSRETAFGNIVADAIRSGTGADIGLMNGGGLRFDGIIPRGPIGTYTIESIFLFADGTPIITVSITGSRLREILENAYSTRNFGAGGFLQVSGIRFTVDRSRPDGSRVVGQLQRENQGLITPSETLRVSMPAWIACRDGDGFSVPEAKNVCRAESQAPRAADLLMRHITIRLGGKVSAPPGGRITIR